ncbi:aspartate aminotransferase family protein [Stetteria hydrogenophila]
MQGLRVLRYYGGRGLRLTRGFMQYVWDDRGRRYLDAHTGHGVAFLGHANPLVVERVKRQLEELPVCSMSFDCDARDEAVRALSRIAPSRLDTVAFANTGTEAVEAALKMAWAATGRSGVVAFKGSFHGRTLGALSVTWNPRYRRGFPVLDVTFLDFNGDPGEVEGALRRLEGSLAAVIVEPVQGEGGVNPATREFLRAVEDAAREAGAVLIVDEVQTGMGRTGRVWAHEHYGVEPDVVTAGKALGGGVVPVSAVLARGDVASSLEGGRHGSTFAGNPVAMAAVAGAVEALTRDDAPGKAAEAGARLLSGLRSRLEGSRLVREVRGLGLMVGVDLRRDPGPVLRCMQERGVLALKAGVSVVRLLPPYMVTPSDVEAMVDVVAGCLGA